MTSLIVLLALGEASAATYDVPSGSLTTLQDAINVAVSGDTINLLADVDAGPDTNGDGDPDATIQSGKDLTITSSAADSAGWFGTLNVLGAATDVTLSGLNVRGGSAQGDVELIELGVFCIYDVGNGLVVDNSANVTIEDTTFGCFVDTAIDIVDGDVVLDDAILEYNIGDKGGGIHHQAGTLEVYGSTIQLNASFTGGGGIYTVGSFAHIEDTRFYGNTATGGKGAGLHSKASSLELWMSEFSNNFNLTWFVPGLLVSDPSDLVGEDIAGLVVAQGTGAGAWVGNPNGGFASADIWANRFLGNIANEGGGLYVEDVRGLEIFNNVFAENWVLHYGGGLGVKALDDWLDSEQAKIVNNTFATNLAGILPPPYPPNVVVFGGGGHIAMHGTIAEFTNNVLTYAQFGGAMLGVDGRDYTIGDKMVVEYNDFYFNCDATTCTETDPTSWAHLTGDFAMYALSQTNIELDPNYVYFIEKDEMDFDGYPDAFYTQWDSPVVRSGNPVYPNFHSDPESDMGAYGGPRAEPPFVLDRDGDGFENVYDCNDEIDENGAAVYPSAPEVCDFVDNDCDGLIDEGFEPLWYPDADGDGFGDRAFAATPVLDCGTPAGMAPNADDCDDDPNGAGANINPDMPEVCDGVDNDCDDLIDGEEDLVYESIWRDQDGDGYGAAGGQPVVGCQADSSSGVNGWISGVDENGNPVVYAEVDYADNNLDCADTDPARNPDTPETCNSVDDDCNGLIDDAGDIGWYYDADGDGYGNEEAVPSFACDPPGAGYVDNNLDCDDGDPEISPDATEICDGVDNDCQEGADLNAPGEPLKYEDLDGDGLGNDATATRDCDPGSTYTATVGGDCDDNDAAVGECAECGCQAAPQPGPTGMLALVLAGMLGIRRRRA